MTTQHPFMLEVSRDSSIPTRLELSGRVTVAASTALHAAALEIHRNQHPTIIDCSRADYIDASAMQVIISLGREMAKDQIPCDLKGIDGPAALSFRLCGVIE